MITGSSPPSPAEREEDITASPIWTTSNLHAGFKLNKLQTLSYKIKCFHYFYSFFGRPSFDDDSSSLQKVFCFLESLLFFNFSLRRQRIVHHGIAASVKTFSQSDLYLGREKSLITKYQERKFATSLRSLLHIRFRTFDNLINNILREYLP